MQRQSQIMTNTNSTSISTVRAIAASCRTIVPASVTFMSGLVSGVLRLLRRRRASAIVQRSSSAADWRHSSSSSREAGSSEHHRRLAINRHSSTHTARLSARSSRVMPSHVSDTRRQPYSPNTGVTRPAPRRHLVGEHRVFLSC